MELTKLDKALVLEIIRDSLSKDSTAVSFQSTEGSYFVCIHSSLNKGARSIKITKHTKEQR